MKEIFSIEAGRDRPEGRARTSARFENKPQNVRRRMKKYGNFDVYILQSTVRRADGRGSDGTGYGSLPFHFRQVSSCCSPLREKDLDADLCRHRKLLGGRSGLCQVLQGGVQNARQALPRPPSSCLRRSAGGWRKPTRGGEVDVHHPDYTVYVEAGPVRLRPWSQSRTGERGGLPTGVGGRGDGAALRRALIPCGGRI